MTSPSATGMLAVAWRITAALLADPVNTFALVATVTAVAILMALAWQPLEAMFCAARGLMVHAGRWITVRAATQHLDREIEHFCNADAEPESQQLPGVVRLERPVPPPPGRRRRRPRIPGRPRARRHTPTSSSSDRRH